MIHPAHWLRVVSFFMAPCLGAWTVSINIRAMADYKIRWYVELAVGAAFALALFWGAQIGDIQ